jgi:hypothetical protein
MEDGFLSIKEDICPLVTMEFIAKIYESFVSGMRCYFI